MRMRSEVVVTFWIIAFALGFFLGFFMLAISGGLEIKVKLEDAKTYSYEKSYAPGVSYSSEYDYSPVKK